jgi:type 2 lantibiotic biosynthesis protein LanM
VTPSARRGGSGRPDPLPGPEPDPDLIGEVVARAATLAERLAVSVPPAREIGSDPAIDRRLDAWQAREPFCARRWWDARLAADGLDQDTLRTLLGERPGDLAARLPQPGWAAGVRVLLGGEHVAAGDPEWGDAPFLRLVAPLLTSARAGLRARVESAVAPQPACGWWDTDLVVDGFYRWLRPQIERMLTRTLVLELNLARADGRLPGDTPQARFASFIEQLGDPATRRRVFATYPVLARQVATSVRSWEDAATAFAERLRLDAPAIEATFAGEGGLGALVSVTPGLGDRHRGWNTVVGVRWSSGTTVVYKPRPLAIDVAFQQLLAWVDERGVTAAFRTIRCLDRGGYGWAEGVEARRCDDLGMVRRFYRRQGGLLALLSLLQATDVHSGNLIACGEQPILVDLESLLDPGLPVDGSTGTAAERLAADAANGSVLGVGLLPASMWAVQAGGGVDLSGLGQPERTPTPLAVPTIEDARTDTMRVVLAHQDITASDHLPVSPASGVRLVDFAPDILDGYTEVYEICLRHRHELLADDGPLARFAGLETRAVLRPTMWYATVLQTGFHPDVLRDGLDRERHFDELWRRVAQEPWMAGCTASERRDFWRADIPVFTVRTDEPVLYDSERRPVAGVTVVPGLDRVRDRLGRLGPDDLDRQQWLVRGSLATAAMADLDASMPSYTPEAVTGPVEPDDLLAAADRIGHRLAALAFDTADSAQWLGANATGKSDWSMGPLRPDIFHGLAGIALFLAWLGELTGDPRHTGLARRATATALRQVERGRLDGAGGFSGLPGVGYALWQLGLLWRDERYLSLAEDCLRRLEPTIDRDGEHDFVLGNAGAVAALRSMCRTGASERMFELLRRAADRLVAAAVPQATGVGWLPRALSTTGQAHAPIAGFAHGVASIAWVLFEASALLGDARHAATAWEALGYEQSLFRPDEGSWTELRTFAGRDVPADAPPPVAWCYGAMGIGLARVLTLPHLGDDATARREIEVALAATERAGFGQCHALCHGDVGNAELFTTAGLALADPWWHEAARLRLASVVASAKKHGWLSGTPLGIETPGLMVGLAGSGYGLLRAAAPDRVPNVLAMLEPGWPTTSAPATTRHPAPATLPT